MEKRVAVEQFLNVPLGAERPFSFKRPARPRRSWLRRAMVPAVAAAALGAAVLAPMGPGGADTPSARAALERPAAPAADPGEIPSH